MTPSHLHLFIMTFHISVDSFAPIDISFHAYSILIYDISFFHWLIFSDMISCMISDYLSLDLILRDI